MLDPEIGFTSNVIRDPKRFVGRTDDIRDCIKAINTTMGLIAVYGKRGVGKSSLLRQIQQMATGDYTLAEKAGLSRLIPPNKRKFLTVYFTCDSMIKNIHDLLIRLCNDQDSEDGLLRLVPDDGKEIVEFSRSSEVSGGADLRVVKWGTKGIDTSKYARVVPGDIVQTFRNFLSSIVTHQVKKHKREGILILLDEFDVLQDKSDIGSLIKSLSSESVKFGVCGIGRDLNDLVEDHSSVERLIEEGAIHVREMDKYECEEIIRTAGRLYRGALIFDTGVTSMIAELSQGYPYLTQLLGKECVNVANKYNVSNITMDIFQEVLNDVKSGRAFPTLESSYQRAIGGSTHRQILLHLLAEQSEIQPDLYSFEVGRVFLKKVRQDAQDLNIDYIDQLLPRLIDKKFGPVLVRIPEKPGVYEFPNPIFRIYVQLRHF